MAGGPDIRKTASLFRQEYHTRCERQVQKTLLNFTSRPLQRYVLLPRRPLSKVEHRFKEVAINGIRITLTRHLQDISQRNVILQVFIQLD